MKNNWTKKWPTEPGYYWFYGYRYGKISVGREVKPEMQLVKVKKGSNCIIYVSEGSFMFKKGVEEAHFTKAKLPEPAF